MIRQTTNKVNIRVSFADDKSVYLSHSHIRAAAPRPHDISNSAGNIHVHIVISGVRTFAVEHQNFMECPADNLAGMRHHVTKNYLEYLKQETMALFQRDGLYQVDLLSLANVRITDREYWAQLKGQAALDKKNAELKASDTTPNTGEIRNRERASAYFRIAH